MAQAVDNSTMRLCDKLSSALLTCKINQSVFLPENCLKALVNVSSIQSELQAELSRSWLFNSQLKLAKRVYEKASKVFAILAMISQVKAMKDLDKEGLTDEELPLDLKALNTLISRSSSKEFKAFAKYPASARLFAQTQWQVLAPILDISGKHITLDDKCALPIVIVDDVTPMETIGSYIFKGTLHNDHCKGFETKDEGGRHIAIKEFRQTQESSKIENFKKEKDNLDELHKLAPHPHLIRAIFSCQIGDMYYTIFPWADGGSLKEFWKCPESRPSDGDHRDLLLWSLRQLRGVADALQALHRTNYRHGDLKPDNILHFKNGNPFCKDSKDVLVIADFGVSKKHRQETNMRVDGTNTRATTPSYEAPEVDGEQTDPRSRRYDMWSMGCILLEFVVWLLYGQDAIERFYEVRVHNCEVENRGASFYERRREEQEEEEEDSPNFGVNPAVEDVMNALKADPRCQGSTAIGDLLALIPQHLLQLEAEKRATANIWWRELDSVVSRAERDESYLVRGVGPSPAIPGAFDRKGKKARAKNPPNHNV